MATGLSAPGLRAVVPSRCALAHGVTRVESAGRSLHTLASLWRSRRQSRPVLACSVLVQPRSGTLFASNRNAAECVYATARGTQANVGRAREQGRDWFATGSVCRGRDAARASLTGSLQPIAWAPPLSGEIVGGDGAEQPRGDPRRDRRLEPQRSRRVARRIAPEAEWRTTGRFADRGVYAEVKRWRGTGRNSARTSRSWAHRFPTTTPQSHCRSGGRGPARVCAG